MQKASELKKGDYVSDIPLEYDNCSIFIFDHATKFRAYYIPIFNCDQYNQERSGKVCFSLDIPMIKISKKTADKYIKDHEEKI